MRFIEVNIRKFGGLQDFEFRFRDGFQCISGPNESGKSTLIAFIRVLFYGFGRNSKDPAKSERLRYRPWESSADMGGSLRFEREEQIFILERSFGAARDQDRTRLWNETLAKEVPLRNPNAPGEEILGLSEAEYIAVCQMRTPADKEQLIGLDERISHLLNSGSEEVDIHALEQKLKRLESDLKKQLSESEERERELESVLSQTLDRDMTRLLSLHRIDELKRNLSQNERRRTICRIRVETDQAREDIDAWQHYLGRKQKLAALHGGDGNIRLPDMKAVPVRELTILSQSAHKVQQARYESSYAENRVQKCAAEQREAQEKLTRAREALHAAEREREQAVRSAGRMRGESVRIPDAGGSVRAGVGIALLLLIAAVFLYFLKPDAAALAGGGAALVLLVTFLLYSEKKKRITVYLRKKELYERRIREREAQIAEALERSRFELEQCRLHSEYIKTSVKTAAEEAEKALRKLESEKRLLLLKLKPWIKEIPPGCEAEEAVQLLRDFSLAEKPFTRGTPAEVEEEEKLRRRFEQASLIVRKNERALQELQASDQEGNPQDRDQIWEEQLRLREALSREEGELSGIDQQLPDTANAEREVLANRENIKDAEKRLQTCRLARRILNDAAERFRSEASPFLQSRASEWLERLSDGKYEQVRIGQNFSLSLEDQGEKRYFEEVYYSSGTRDLLWIALRLAVGEMIMSHSPSLPLLMDDSLTQLDRERKMTAIRALEKAAREQGRQIILLTAEGEAAAEMTQAVYPLK